MKLPTTVLALATTAAVVVGGAVLTIADSEAAPACAAGWSPSTVYVKGNAASQNGHNYTAKWWTQGESPARSGRWDVWADAGACGGTAPSPPATSSGSTPSITPTTTPPQPPPAAGGRVAAPYLYPGWGEPPEPATVVKATGIKTFTMAFVLAGNGCTPAWDGESGLTGGAHASTISAIRAAGADVIPSVGGWQGNKLGPNCTTVEALAGAYQKIVDTFSLTAIDIDIENSDEFENPAVQDRVLGALKVLKQRRPGLTTIVTFGTSTSGPSYYGTRLVQQAKALDANIDVFTQMPFDFGGGADMYTATVNASEGLKNLLKSTFGWTDAQAYAHLGISGMNGLSDQQELTSVETWTRIRDYARAKGLARLAFWAVNRDRGCAGGGVVSNCSGVAQTDWAFTKISAGF